jgi:hypothetical protein
MQRKRNKALGARKRVWTVGDNLSQRAHLPARAKQNGIKKKKFRIYSEMEQNKAKRRATRKSDR